MIANADRAPFRALDDFNEQVGQLGVAMTLHESGDIVTSPVPARLTDNADRQLSEIGESERAVADHRPDRITMPRRPLAADLGLPQDAIDAGDADLELRRDRLARHALTGRAP